MLYARASVVFLALPLLVLPFGACELEPEEVNQVPVTGGAAAVAVSVASSGGAGGADVEPSRGDPADFPDDCPTSCDEACAALDSCKGEDSPIFPLGKDECLQRCNIAQNGPLWDDVSGNFMCCTAQANCARKQHCGGWLKEPSADSSCTTLCGCFFSADLDKVNSNYEAPQGYRFAPDLLTLKPHLAGKRSVRGRRQIVEHMLEMAKALSGVQVHHDGLWPTFRLDNACGARELKQLQALGQRMPTFVDAKGRLSTATRAVVVQLDAAELEAPLREAVADAGTLTKLRYGTRLYRIEAKDGWQALRLLERLSSFSGAQAELDMMRHYRLRHTPDDPDFGKQWHLKNTGQSGGIAGVDGRVSEAWDKTLGDPKVVIAVNDDGMDLNHPEFAGRLLQEQNFPSDWAEQMKQAGFGSHGTSCGGVAAAAGDNATFGSGVCPNCSILPRLLGTNVGGGFQVSDKQVADGFVEMVDAGAWVISNSWGPSGGNPVYEESTLPSPALSMLRKAAFDHAETKGRGGKGTVIVFASGNSNAPVDAQSAYLTNVAVSAVNDLGFKSYYSSFGSGIDIAAPSNGGLGGIATAAINGGSTDSFGGTSSACPYVAGVFGLVLAADPELSADEARKLVYASARKIDPVYGDYDEKGMSIYYGHGMIDAYRAVKLATKECNVGDLASCAAPSDDCGSSCQTKVNCESCRSDADCATGFRCQQMASMLDRLCVAEKSDGPCPSETVEVNGHCLPTPQSCMRCEGSELCNGRDEDCDGEVDEGANCDNGRYCWPGGPSCPSGSACAGVRCIDICSSDQDCSEGQKCKLLKDGYGAVTMQKGCVASAASQCEVGCQVIASSLADAELKDFVDCMQDGQVSCPAVFSCTSKLPISMGAP